MKSQAQATTGCFSQKSNAGIMEKKEEWIMETKDVIASSEAKLTAKNCDYIVANDLREAGAGFGTGTNHVRILSRDGVVDLGLLSKAETARRILDHCLGGK